jgi:hypothetical protein
VIEALITGNYFEGSSRYGVEVLTASDITNHDSANYFYNCGLGNALNYTLGPDSVAGVASLLTAPAGDNYKFTDIAGVYRRVAEVRDFDAISPLNRSYPSFGALVPNDLPAGGSRTSFPTNLGIKGGFR